MKQHQSIGIFSLACSAICFIIAFERYQSAVTTAQEIAKRLEGFEYESVSIPTVSIVAGLAGVILLVAGALLVFESRRKVDADPMLT